MSPVPPNSDFDFDFEEEHPRALAAIQADPRIDDIRIKLVRFYFLRVRLTAARNTESICKVPSKMKDPEFFKRYFYKVSAVRQDFYKGPAICFVPISGTSGIQLAAARKGASGTVTQVPSPSATVRFVFLT
jgi:hypothetical protein